MAATAEDAARTWFQAVQRVRYSRHTSRPWALDGSTAASLSLSGTLIAPSARATDDEQDRRGDPHPRQRLIAQLCRDRQGSARQPGPDEQQHEQRVQDHLVDRLHGRDRAGRGLLAQGRPSRWSRRRNRHPAIIAAETADVMVRSVTRLSMVPPGSVWRRGSVGVVMGPVHRIRCQTFHSRDATIMSDRLMPPRPPSGDAPSVRGRP